MANTSPSTTLFTFSETVLVTPPTVSVTVPVASEKESVMNSPSKGKEGKNEDSPSLSELSKISNNQSKNPPSDSDFSFFFSFFY